MGARGVAIGYTGNYFDRLDLRSYYARLAALHRAATFFHPLRATNSRIRGEGELGVTADQIANNILLNQGILQNDAERLAKRLRTVVRLLNNITQRFGRPGRPLYLRIVMHTEYALPLWCSKIFRSVYIEVINKILKFVSGIQRESNIVMEAIIELHPGFTALEECRVTGGRIRCKRVERDVEKLADCIEALKSNIDVVQGPSGGVRFCIEPRAGSIVSGKKVFEPQTINTLEEAYIFARDMDLGLVVDPGQSILKRVGMDMAWEEVLRIVHKDPDMVEEVHVHSPVARSMRGHGLPSREELAKYADVIRNVVVGSRTNRRPLGVVFEVLHASTAGLKNITEELITLLRKSMEVS